VTAHVSALARYPVKSCRGHALERATVEPWGLAGDRRWMLVDPDGGFLTARRHPRLLQVEPEVDGAGLVLRAPGAPPLRTTASGPAVEVEVWGDRVPAVPADDAAHAWFSAHLGAPVRLVHLADPTRRPVDPGHARPDDRVSFADGFPLLLATEASLAALDGLAGGPALAMARFRPNVVVAGTAPWAEDGWTGVRVGAAAFRAPKPCGRCVVTTLDPATGARGREPLAALAVHRRRGAALLFGVNLVPDTPGAVIRVGDPVEPW
jgi:uncharacterized protein